MASIQDICVTGAPFEASILLMTKNFNSPSSSRMGGAHSNAMPVPYSGKQFTVVAKDDISHITKPNPT